MMDNTGMSMRAVISRTALSKNQTRALSIQAWSVCRPAHSSRSTNTARAARAAAIRGELRMTAAKAAMG